MMITPDMNLLSYEDVSKQIKPTLDADILEGAGVAARMPTPGMVKQVRGIQRMNRLFNAVIDADHAHIRSLDRNRFTGKRAKAKFERALAKQRKKGRKTYTP